MTTSEDAALRREILTELSPLFVEGLASHAWGRLLVHTERRPDGSLRVRDLELDDIVGPEADIERAMSAEETRAMLPILADAVDALASTWDVAIDEVGGGTFVRDDAGAFHHLPALVRAPSRFVDDQRDAALAWSTDAFTALRLPDSASLEEVDAEEGRAVFVDGSAKRELPCVVLATFVRASWTFAWAHANPSLPEAARVRCHDVLDAFVDRSVWEVSTPQLATDEATAWALAAIVARDRGFAPLAVRQPQGTLFLLLRDGARDAS